MVKSSSKSLIFQWVNLFHPHLFTIFIWRGTYSDEIPYLSSMSLCKDTFPSPLCVRAGFHMQCMGPVWLCSYGCSISSTCANWLSSQNNHVSSIPVRSEMSSIQLYVIKYFSDLRHDITEILLQTALDIITLTLLLTNHQMPWYVEVKKLRSIHIYLIANKNRPIPEAPLYIHPYRKWPPIIRYRQLKTLTLYICYHSYVDH